MPTSECYDWGMRIETFKNENPLPGQQQDLVINLLTGSQKIAKIFFENLLKIFEIKILSTLHDFLLYYDLCLRVPLKKDFVY